MKYKNLLFSILTVVLFISCTPSPLAQELYRDRYSTSTTPINLIPMYGYPDVEKTVEQKKVDEEFIKTIVTNSGSRTKGAKEFAAWGWGERRKNNLDNAMRRFNQSWLLDPNYYQPYWGFGVLSLVKGRPAKAAIFFEKGLNLIDDDKEKSRLMVDAAKAYAWQGSELKKTDVAKSEAFYKKANALIEAALNVNPEYANTYYYGAFIYRDQGDYKKAWKIVKKARASGTYHFKPEFIDDLSEKMPEPK